MVTTPVNGQATTHANGAIGFAASSPEVLNAWHAVGCASAGACCEDSPGVRDLGFVKLYCGYLRDPFDNKLCAIHPMG